MGQDSGGQADDISIPRDKNHKKNLKKKLKKVKTRMSQRQDQFEEQLNGQNPPVKLRVVNLRKTRPRKLYFYTINNF